MEERISMLGQYDTGAFTVTELSQRFGVSRETFYVWKQRRDSGDPHWYEEQSRSPYHCPHKTAEVLTAKIIALRQRFPQWGPKKIRAKLLAVEPAISWPAASTIGDILKREGLIKSTSKRRRGYAQAEIIAGADLANDEWAIDFKGWFRTRDGARCDPLTVSDTSSRYLLDARIVPPTYKAVRSAMARLFNENGLPSAIRSDNGSPFGSSGAGGLSRLSVWFLKLGIEPHHIPPASPQDNGRHERMHRTLKAETTCPPASCAQQQQERFNQFCSYYNEERPHEALGQALPADHWQPSNRAMPERLDEPWYDADHQVRMVRSTGQIRWQGDLIFISGALASEPIGLYEIDLGLYVVRFCGRDLGLIDRNTCFHSFAPPRARLRGSAQTGRTKVE